VVGSRQFRAFEDYLISRLDFDRGLKEKTFPAAIPTTAAVYLEEHLSLLRKTLDQSDALARDGQLPDVELNSTGLKISPLENSVPKEADDRRDEALAEPTLNARRIQA
jgi:hypothetical protein